jgi:hypothetical protein
MHIQFSHVFFLPAVITALEDAFVRRSNLFDLTIAYEDIFRYREKVVRCMCSSHLCNCLLTYGEILVFLQLCNIEVALSPALTVQK